MTEPRDALRRRILEAALPEVAFDGWTQKTLDQAVKAAGLAPGEAQLLFPGGGIELLKLWSATLDAETYEALKATDLKPLKIRARVTLGVRLRIEAHGAYKAAARRAGATLALPHNAALAPELSLKTADAIWRGIGDASADFNWYTKRLLLAGVYGSTMLFWHSDDSDGAQKTWDFLDRRIENVMQIEKVKAGVQGFTANLPDPFAFLAKLRYPGRG